MGFFGDIGGFLSKAVDVASMIPGPHQPFALAGSAIKRLPGASTPGETVTQHGRDSVMRIVKVIAVLLLKFF